MSATTDPATPRAPAAGTRPSLAGISLGAVFIGVAGWLLGTFPVGRAWLACLAVLLAVAQWRNERAWLVALPLLFGTLDLAGWSGRFLFSEQDALLAALVGTALLSGRYRGCGGQLLRRGFAPLWLIVAGVAVGLVLGLQPPLDLDANAWNGYLTSWNAARIAKGPFWALILWPLLGGDRAVVRDRHGCGASRPRPVGPLGAEARCRPRARKQPVGPVCQLDGPLRVLPRHRPVLADASGRRGHRRFPRSRLAVRRPYGALAAAVFIHGFRLGGTLTMSGFLLIVLAATATAMALRRKAAAVAAGILLILLAAGVALSIHGMTSSKWNDVDAQPRS